MTFSELINSIENLANLTNVTTEVIGFSTFNNPIYAFHVGSFAGKQVFMEGGIHAREYLSTLFLIEEIKFLNEMYQTNQFSEGGFYVVPLVNPDGVALVLDGIKSVKCEIQKQVLTLINNGSNNFNLWKANGLGVDLNVNFNAEWGKGNQNKVCPNSENFIGFYPESEREVQVLLNYVKQTNPGLTISWHTKGEVIYYGFYTLSSNSLARDYNIALELSKVNGYQVIKTEGSVGGFSDWVSLNLDVPAYTIELGSSAIPHPLTESNLQIAFNQNKQVPVVALKQIS